MEYQSVMEVAEHNKAQENFGTLGFVHLNGIHGYRLQRHG